MKEYATRMESIHYLIHSISDGKSTEILSWRKMGILDFFFHVDVEIEKNKRRAEEMEREQKKLEQNKNKF